MGDLLSISEAGITGSWHWVAGASVAGTTIVAIIISKLGDIMRGLNTFKDEWAKFHKPKKHDYIPQLKMDADITQHLRTIKHDLQASRVLIVQLHNGEYSLARVPFLKYSCSHEQLARDVSSVMLHLEKVQASMFASLNMRLMEGENICFPDLNEAVEKDPSLNTLGQFLSAHGTKSIYFFPLMKADGEVYGMGVVEYIHKRDLELKWIKWTHARFIQIGALLNNVAYEEDEVSKQ